MRTFDISIVQDTVAVKQGEEAVLTFTVTNVSGRDLRALAKLVPENDEHVAWLRVEGEDRREVGSAQSDTIVVKIKPPQAAPPGAGRFRLVVASEENPDEDFADAVAQFTVERAPQAPAPERRPRRWWIIAAAAGLVVAVVVIVLSLRPEPVEEVPVEPETVQGVYAITDVMVTDDEAVISDQAHSMEVLGEYTGVSSRKPTVPYIPEQVEGRRLTASNVNAGKPSGTPTSIWIKYERLPEDSDKLVLVDIEVFHIGEFWSVDNRKLKSEGFDLANGTSYDPKYTESIRGALNPGVVGCANNGLAVKYIPLRDTSERIIALRLLTDTEAPQDSPANVEDIPATAKRAGVMIHWSYETGGQLGHGSYLIKYVVGGDLTGDPE